MALSVAPDFAMDVTLSQLLGRLDGDLAPEACAGERPPLSGFRPAAEGAVALGALIVALQRAVGSRTWFHSAAECTRTGEVWVVVDFDFAPMALAAARESLEILAILRNGLPVNVKEHVARLREVRRGGAPDAWARALLDEAGRRKIPGLYMPGCGILELGQGRHLRRLSTSWPLADAAAVAMAEDHLSARDALLRSGVTVLPAAWVDQPSSALAFANRHGYPVRGWLMPRVGAPTCAYRAADARSLSRACARLGRRDRRHVIERMPTGPVDEFVAWGHARMTLPSTQSERPVEVHALREGAEDPGTDDGRDLAARALAASGLYAAVVGVTAAGSVSGLEEAAVVSVAAGEQLRAALVRTPDLCARLAADTLALAFPDGGTGRIPFVVVAGACGLPSPAELIARLLRSAGWRPWVKCPSTASGSATVAASDEGRRASDAGLPWARRDLDAAVIEVGCGTLVREGMPCDCVDVGVVLGLESEHLGEEGVHTLEDVAAVEALVVAAIRPGGYAVLNATDRRVADMRIRTGANAVWLWTLDAPLPEFVQGELESGGAAVALDGGMFTLHHGPRTLAMGHVPADVLGRAQTTTETLTARAAAIGVGYAMGIALDVIRAAAT